MDYPEENSSLPSHAQGVPQCLSKQCPFSTWAWELELQTGTAACTAGILYSWPWCGPGWQQFRNGTSKRKAMENAVNWKSRQSHGCVSSNWLDFPLAAGRQLNLWQTPVPQSWIWFLQEWIHSNCCSCCLGIWKRQGKKVKLNKRIIWEASFVNFIKIIGVFLSAVVHPTVLF